MEATKNPNSSDGALSATRSLIQDGRWRPIAEAPAKDDILVMGESCLAIVYPWCNDWMPSHISCGDSDLKPSLYFSPARFRPLPDNRLADALEVAVEKISLAISYADDGAPLSARRVIEEALAKIEQIAKGVSDDNR